MSAAPSLAEQLAAARALKKTTHVSDKSAPKLSGLPKESDIKKAHAEVLDCNLEVWLDAIRDVTFPTALVPLTADDCRLVCDAYREMKKSGGELSASNVQKTGALTAKVQAAVEQIRLSAEYVFGLATHRASIQLIV